jgi:hypothetical protein
MQLVDAAMPTFARHETFHPRYGWFRKAYSVGADDPHIFARDEAPVKIGVGKNMVRAIRFWGLAAKLIVEDSHAPNRRKPSVVPTRFGQALFGKSGWDPYMEDPGTLWLLHWMLLAPPSRLPVWWLAFHEFYPVEFTDEDLESVVLAQLEGVPGWTMPHQSSLKKDISALLRTYAPAEAWGRAVLDDLLDCPLRELNLIGRSTATGRYRFVLGAKPTLPSAVVTFAALDFVARTSLGGNTVTLSRLVNEPGGPGRTFKLSEPALLDALEPTVTQTAGLSLVAPTGATQLSWSTDPRYIGADVLNEYYGRVGDDFCAGHDGDQPVDDELVEEIGRGRARSDTEPEQAGAAGVRR